MPVPGRIDVGAAHDDHSIDAIEPTVGTGLTRRQEDRDTARPTNGVDEDERDREVLLVVLGRHRTFDPSVHGETNQRLHVLHGTAPRRHRRTAA